MAVVRFRPSAKYTPDIGELIAIDIRITDAYGLTSVTGEVVYDDELVSFIGGYYGNFLNVGGTPRLRGDHIFIDVEDTNNPAQITGGLLATLNFTVIKKQELEFTLRNFDGEDANGRVVISEYPPAVFEDPTDIEVENLIDDINIQETIPVIQDPTVLTDTTVIPQVEHLLTESNDNYELVRLYEGDSDKGESIQWEWETNDFPLPDIYTVVSGIFVVHSGTPQKMRIQVFIEGEEVEDSMFTPTKANRFRKGLHARGNQLKVIVSGDGEPPPMAQIDIEYS